MAEIYVNSNVLTSVSSNAFTGGTCKTSVTVTFAAYAAYAAASYAAVGQAFRDAGCKTVLASPSPTEATTRSPTISISPTYATTALPTKPPTYAPTSTPATPNCVDRNVPNSGCCSGAITLDAAMVSIATSAFSSCALTGALVIPDSVTLINDYAFQVVTGITSVDPR